MTQADRAIETLHDAFHEAGGPLYWHNVAEAEVDRVNRKLIYLWNGPDAGGAAASVPFRVAIAVICAPTTVQFRTCTIGPTDNLRAMGLTSQHERSYEGLTAGEVLALIGQMGIPIPKATIESWIDKAVV